MAVASSACLPGRGGIMVRGTTCTDPRVDLGQLTLPETANLMGGQALVLDPAVDRVLSDPEVFGDIVDGDPGFGHQSFLPITLYWPPSGNNRYDCSRKILPALSRVVNSSLRSAIEGESRRLSVDPRAALAGPVHSQPAERRKRRHRSVARVREQSAEARARVSVYGILWRDGRRAHPWPLAYTVTMVYTCGMMAHDIVARPTASFDPGMEPCPCHHPLPHTTRPSNTSRAAWSA